MKPRGCARSTYLAHHPTIDSQSTVQAIDITSDGHACSYDDST